MTTPYLKARRRKDPLFWVGIILAPIVFTWGCHELAELLLQGMQ